jgi:toxin-antitoxin system PIN domain toxin
MQLLDVNLLIALCDADHVDHGPAKKWFANMSSLGWATCPLTENALLRILGHPEYPGGPGSPVALLPLLQQLRAHPNHVFLHDSISLADSHLVSNLSQVTPKMLTDIYLLALAVSHGGVLVTLDKRIDPQRVRGGSKALVVIGT